MSNQKIRSTTQQFTEIEDIINDVVYFKGNYSAMILEVASVNFYLLSKEEQEARIIGFMSLLNSLNFYIQILIVSKNVDVSSYLGIIDQKLSSETRPQLLEHLKRYKEFVQSLVKTRNLLDKKFYLILPFSSLELGPIPQGAAKTKSARQTQLKQTENVLTNKKAGIITQLQRMGLASRQLTGKEIVQLFHEVYNQENLNVEFDQTDPKNIIL